VRPCTRIAAAVVAAVALAAPAAALAAPTVLFVDVPSGPVSGGPRGLGVPIAIFGAGFGASRGLSQVTIGGRPVARYVSWGRRNAHNPALDMVVVQPGPHARSGAIVVTVAGRRSNATVGFRGTSGRVLAIARTGADAGRCLLRRPCATISYAQAQMRPGDALLVRGGVYAESEVWIRGDMGQSGRPQRAKVIKAYPGERAVLANAARPVILDADYVTVAGIEFRNGKSIDIPDTGLPGHRGDRLVDDVFSGTVGFDAVGLHGDGHLAAGDVCAVSGSTVGTEGHCFYVSYGSGDRLLYNVASGAPGYGIHVFDQQRSSSDFRRVIRNLTIVGNRLASSTERSGLILAMGDEGHLGNRIVGVTIRGNLFTHSNHLGLTIGPNVANVRIVGNRFVQNGRQGLYIADDATIDGVLVARNRFVESANPFCRSNCSWYALAHLQIGPRARGVRLAHNRYGPGRPIVIRR